MPAYLCLSVIFLDPEYHGRRDGGEPEWPASPLRMYQALVAAAAARWGERQHLTYAAPALKWLAKQPPPIIVAPPGRVGAAYRLSVPNNAMDLVGRAWARGNDGGKGDANPATHRAMKTVRPMRLPDAHQGSWPEDQQVTYLWALPDPLTEEVRGFAEVLAAAARSLVALGWGTDLVAGNGRVITATEADRLHGEKWLPTAERSGGLRVPIPGTLEALTQRHEAFLGRLQNGGLTPVPPLSAFAVFEYRPASRPAPRPVAAFEVWRPVQQLAELAPGRSKFRPYDPVRHCASLAGMMRHAAADAAKVSRPGDDAWHDTFVLGHGDGEQGQATTDRRFAFLPLPSLERWGTKHGSGKPRVSMIRRVLVVGPVGGAAEVEWVRRALSGQELTDEATRRPAAVLSVVPVSDRNVQPYVHPSGVWSTVTPVVLPGRDDACSAKTERLLRRAIEQAGFSEELARCADLEWRIVGYLPGVDLATRYEQPAHLKGFPRYHVRLRWRNASGGGIEVPGPVVMGAGRYCGLGLFAGGA